jgi:hypothetical protein
VELLQALDTELAQNSVSLRLPDDQPLEWSAAERLTLETIADSIDRRVDLHARYLASDDDKVRLKLSGEVRLLDMAIDRLLKRVHTDLPPAKSLTSVKASQAAHTRWQRDATR